MNRYELNNVDNCCLGIVCVLFNAMREFSYLVINRSALCHKLADFFVSVHDGGVISTPEELSNFWQ